MLCPLSHPQFTSVVIASLYYDVRPVSQTSIQDIRGALFLMISELVYTISYGVFYTFPAEMPLIRREVGEKSYTLSMYYLHKVLYSVPRAFFESFLFIGVAYAFVGFSTDFATYCCMSLVSSGASVLAMAYGMGVFFNWSHVWLLIISLTVSQAICFPVQPAP